MLAQDQYGNYVVQVWIITVAFINHSLWRPFFPLFFLYRPVVSWFIFVFPLARAGAWKATWTYCNHKDINREDCSHEPAEICLKRSRKVFSLRNSCGAADVGEWDARFFRWEWSSSGLSISYIDSFPNVIFGPLCFWVSDQYAPWLSVHIGDDEGSICKLCRTESAGNLWWSPTWSNPKPHKDSFDYSQKVHLWKAHRCSCGETGCCRRYKLSSLTSTYFLFFGFL